MSSNAQSILSGNGWTARKANDTFIVSVADKTSITQALNDFITSQHITGGEVTGIGAVTKPRYASSTQILKSMLIKPLAGKWK